MVGLLEVPAVLASLVVQANNRRGEEIVTSAIGAVVVRPGIADLEKDHAQIGVDRRHVPDRATTRLPGVARPGVVAVFAWSRHGIEPPDLLAGLAVQRHHPSAQATVAAAQSRKEQAVVVQRRHGDAVVVHFGLTDVGAPHQLAGLLVHRDQVPVGLTAEDHAVADRYAAICPDQPTWPGRRQVRRILPLRVAGLCIQGEDVVLAGGDVHHTVLHDWSSLLRKLVGHA